MPRYFIRFTPLAPYFFGNQKSSGVWAEDADGKRFAASYFLPSEQTPAQTTILGALRYCCLTKINADFSVDEENKKRIGPESFDLFAPRQKFGAIQSISPLYLTDGKNLYLRTPFDHNMAAQADHYTPLEDYREVTTAQGTRLLPSDYNPKSGWVDGFLNPADSSFAHPKGNKNGLFEQHVRVGVQTGGVQEGGFYKRQYWRLARGFSFAVFAETDLEMPARKVICIGQRKSPFSVSFEAAEPWAQKEREGLAALEKKAPPITRNGRTYRKAVALSDLYLPGDIYAVCAFACTRLRERRSFLTNYTPAANFRKRFKTPKHYNTLQAGSVFWVEQGQWSEFVAARSLKNGEQIGLNQITGVYLKPKEGEKNP